MEKLKFTPQSFANETPTVNHFMKYAVSSPMFLANASTAYRANAPLQSFLAERGYVGTETGNRSIYDRGKHSYKRIDSREIRWPVATPRNRKGIMTRVAVCDAYPAIEGGTPGKSGTEVQIYSNTNWFSPRDVIELEDNETYLFFYTNELPKEVAPGEFLYRAKLISKAPNKAYIDPAILQKGAEFGVVYNMYEEMSETAYEKYSMGKFMRTFTTIMRLKWSISGSAEKTKTNNVIWTSHNKENTWMSHAENEMMETFFTYRERNIKWGQGTINESGKAQMTLENGVEIWAGEGIMNQGDGSWDMPVNKITRKFLDAAMGKLKLYSNADGIQEVVYLTGTGGYGEFQDAMSNIVKVQPEYVDRGGKKTKGVNTTFEYYEYGGVRIYPIRDAWYDDATRPGYTTDDGFRSSSFDGLILSVGERSGALDRNVELLALDGREFIQGSVNGMNKGGDMANSVDAMHSHVLSETGVALKDPDSLIKIYRPRKQRAFYV